MNFEKSILKYKNKLMYFNYSSNTIRDYSHYWEKFLISINKYEQHLTSKDLESYLLNFSFSSISQQNQIINALKFGWEKALNKKYNKIDFQRPRKEKKLPQIIDKQLLLNSISNIKNLKHKSILSIGYSVGLRVSEVCNLKISDIDSKRMLITIKEGKGKKDRYVPLTLNVLNLLREYYKEYYPKEYLFNGRNSLKYSQVSCNKLVKKYIGNNHHFHQLRHAAFTHLSEQGVDIHHIQKLAGHNSPKTTEIYLHLSKESLQNLPLAL